MSGTLTGRPLRPSPHSSALDRSPLNHTALAICGPEAKAGFPIVGIGCSAGGLEALEHFFARVPAACGMAFVVVQHLSPTHTSALPELLQHYTRLKVLEVEDGQRVQPGSVHVIPPNRDLALQNGVLHLLEPAVTAHGLRLPIDFFLRSLAADQKQAAVGVVLSGMGSDGMLGLTAIKEQRGLTLAQDPATAQADGMPSSAINAGVVDIVAEAEALASHIAEHLHAPLAVLEAEPAPAATSALDRICVLLRDRVGVDFSLYKANTLYRRIERRMGVRLTPSIEAYALFLRNEPQELDLLFAELLIGVTHFFRDTAVWDALRDVALPAVLAQHPGGRTMRAWVPACSTGEEAYSLAIAFTEVLETLRPPGRFSLQIFATDLDPAAVERARKGVFPKTIETNVSAERLARHFTAEDGGYRVSRRLRESVVFAVQNIAADPPFTKLDLLLCRNLLIYFGPKLQAKLLPLFHFALCPGGLLVLGSAETVGNFGRLFEPVNLRARIFRRNQQAMTMSELDLSPHKPTNPAASASRPSAADGAANAAETSENLGRLTDQLVQQNWAPAAVLVTADGDILYISGRTGRYLEPAAGKTNINVHAMAREGLREALVGMIRKALKDRPQPLLLPRLRITGDGGRQQLVDVTLQGLDKPEPLCGHVLIVFKDLPAPPTRRRSSPAASGDAHSALTQELLQAREALQVVQEEMQTTVEELKSNNEELQATNEELQSTNEELTTSKEELQSLNEELQTVNAELQSKVEDLSSVKNDMSNLLNSTDIATIFVDSSMNLRRFTTQATRVFRLIQGDVGRPLAHVVTDLDYPDLVADAREVLRSLAFKETEAATADGRWFRVREMPYRTLDNLIDGVVITFTDITEIKLLEAELRRPRAPALDSTPPLPPCPPTT